MKSNCSGDSTPAGERHGNGDMQTTAKEEIVAAIARPHFVNRSDLWMFQTSIRSCRVSTTRSIGQGWSGCDSIHIDVRRKRMVRYDAIIGPEATENTQPRINGRGGKLSYWVSSSQIAQGVLLGVWELLRDVRAGLARSNRQAILSEFDAPVD
jgi:hypothetical protein